MVEKISSIYEFFSTSSVEDYLVGRNPSIVAKYLIREMVNKSINYVIIHIKLIL